MKLIKIILFAGVLLLSYSCKAQINNNQEETINIYSTQILGTWLDEEDDSYKLVFLSNGNCKEYSDNELISTYQFSLEQNSCDSFSATNVIYLKWYDPEDLQTTCLEMLNITDETLSLMIIEKASRLFFNRQ